MLQIIGRKKISLVNANIIADGNSYVQGNGYTPFPTLIRNGAPFSTNGSGMQNFGVGGQTTPQMLSNQSSQVLSLYNSSVANILLVVEGGNDIYNNGSVTTAVNNYIQYCQNAKTAGFKVIVATCIPRGQSTVFGDNSTQYNLKLTQFNTAIVAYNYLFHGIIRPELEGIFSSYSAGGYDADQVHPNNAGQQKYADLFSQAIQKL